MECTSASSTATALEDTLVDTPTMSPTRAPPSPLSQPPAKKSRAPPTWRDKARAVPGAGTLARLTVAGGGDVSASPSPFAAAAWTPFARGATGSSCSDDENDHAASSDDDGVCAGPAPAAKHLQRAPTRARADWSDDPGCNSSDSEWARAGAGGASGVLMSGMPPRVASDVLLPWDML